MNYISRSEFNQFKAEMMKQLCSCKNNTCNTCNSSSTNSSVVNVLVQGDQLIVTYSDGNIIPFPLEIIHNYIDTRKLVTDVTYNPTTGQLTISYSDSTTNSFPLDTSIFSIDEKVKVSITDTTNGFLKGKSDVLAVENLVNPQYVIINPSGDERNQLQLPKGFWIDYSMALSSILVKGNFPGNTGASFTLNNIPAGLTTYISNPQEVHSFYIDNFNKFATVICELTFVSQTQFTVSELEISFINMLSPYIAGSLSPKVFTGFIDAGKFTNVLVGKYGSSSVTVYNSQLTTGSPIAGEIVKIGFNFSYQLL